MKVEMLFVKSRFLVAEANLKGYGVLQSMYCYHFLAPYVSVLTTVWGLHWGCSIVWKHRGLLLTKLEETCSAFRELGGRRAAVGGFQSWRVLTDKSIGVLIICKAGLLLHF